MRARSDGLKGRGGFAARLDQRLGGALGDSRDAASAVVDGLPRLDLPHLDLSVAAAREQVERALGAPAGPQLKDREVVCVCPARRPPLLW